MSLVLALVLAVQNIDAPPPSKPPGYREIRAMEVPVIAGDINDRPYRVIGNIETQVRKLTVFEKDPSEAKVYRELWERAHKLGADAVVNAKYGETLYGGWTWGRRHASGQAIKFLSDDEIARLMPADRVRLNASPPPRNDVATPTKPASPSKKPSTVTCITCN